MAVTPGWNHSESPLDLLEVQKNVDRFKKDLKDDPKFLQKKIRRHLLDNPHRLTLLMTPDEAYAREEQEKLDEIESRYYNSAVIFFIIYGGKCQSIETLLNSAADL